MPGKRLFFTRIPQKDPRVAPLVQDLSVIPALQNLDLRRILVGSGLYEFPAADTRTGNDIHSVLLKHQLSSMIIDDKKFSPSRNRKARSVKLSETKVSLFDRKGNCLLEIDPDSDVYIIMTDVSGRYQARLLRARKSEANRCNLEEVLDGIARFTPVADIYSLQKNGSAVRIDSRDFAFAGLENKLGVSRGFCFANLIREIDSCSRSLRFDDKFDASENAGCVTSDSSSLLDIYGALMLTDPARNFKAGSETETAQEKSGEEEKGRESEAELRRVPPPPSVERSTIGVSLPESMALLPLVFLIMFPLLLEVTATWLSLSSDVLTFLINAGGLLSILYGLHLLRKRSGRESASVWNQ